MTLANEIKGYVINPCIYRDVDSDVGVKRLCFLVDKKWANDSFYLLKLGCIYYD